MKFVSAISLVLAVTAAAPAENWPQWRGPAGDGISAETNLPTHWSDKENVAWKLALPGMGESTPAVWGDRLFLTCQDGDHVALLCVGVDGEELWRRPVGPGGKKIRGDEGNGASASPSTDGQHVYAFCGSGELACFDFDGKPTWAFNVQDRYGKFQMQWGFHSTPLLDGDRVYLQLFHSGAHLLVALNKANGDEIWKVERKSDGRDENEQSYASLVMWRNGKDAYLIAHGDDYATAHRLTDGSEIWRVGGLNPKDHYRGDLRFVASPVATPDLIVIPSAKNHPVVAVKPDATGLIEDGSPGQQWRKPDGTPDVPSPLVYDGLVYLCREDGRLVCLDAKTGEAKYSERLHASKYRASPLYADGALYLTAYDGVVTVVKAGPKFEKIAENTLPDHFQASPAVSGGRIYLHGFDALWAIGAPNPAGKVTPVPKDLRDSLNLSPFYKKYTDADGFPILSSEKVLDVGLLEAADIVNHMLDGRDDVRQAIIKNKVRLAVMAPDEQTTDVPEHSDLTPKAYWDRRARGLGATPVRPAVSCGEENLLNLKGDRYDKENILVHEFGHVIHEMGMNSIDPDFDGKLKACYDRAMEKGTWKDTYAATNYKEYWAEGVQAYFDFAAPSQPGNHNDINTREKLEKSDPDLFDLMDGVFKKNPWHYVRYDRRPAAEAVP